jgi:hypothetical protein
LVTPLKDAKHDNKFNVFSETILYLDTIKAMYVSITSLVCFKFHNVSGSNFYCRECLKDVNAVFPGDTTAHLRRGGLLLLKLNEDYFAGKQKAMYVSVRKWSFWNDNFCELLTLVEDKKYLHLLLK